MGPIISTFPRVFNGVDAGSKQASFLRACGFTHGDLLIRKNFAVSEDSSESEFDALFEQYRSEGISLHTAITDLNAPCSNMEKILGVCARHDLRKIKIGPYWYQNRSFRELVTMARKDLEGLVKLSREYGVQILVQNHGGTINSSPSLCRQLVEGLDPENVGIYFDPGNMMHLDGHEAWAMGLDIIGEYLAYVGIKNVRWLPDDGRGTRTFCRLRDGIIDYAQVLTDLTNAGYQGNYSVHSFYVADGSIYDQKTIGDVMDDLHYFKDLLAAAPK